MESTYSPLNMDYNNELETLTYLKRVVQTSVHILILHMELCIVKSVTNILYS